jgi:hydroxyacylglutathione hydrolase
MPNNIESFPWIHGVPDCSASTDPPLQAFQYDANTFILRQSKCLNFEAPFLYLLLGSEKALLLDTGAEPPVGLTVPVRDTVQGLIREWQKSHGNPELHLIVAHSHSHGDHVAGDDQFVGQPNTHLVRPDLDEVKSFFGFTNWPQGSAELNLGGRALTILPIPGHEQSHIAVYDAGASVLLTGDTLYPGLLTVQDWPSYRLSAARLARFASARPIAFVLGAHIEMKRTPRQMYPLTTTFQPDEHALPLMAQHIQAWQNACEAMGDHPHHDVHSEFIIEPL